MKKCCFVIALCLALVLTSGCGLIGEKTEVVTSPDLPAAELISLPALETTFSTSFEIWVDNTLALVARNNQDPETYVTDKDFFLYDTKKHTYSEVILPESEGVSLQLAAVLDDRRLLFESERIDSTGDEGELYGYTVNFAWIYDISAKAGTKFDLSAQTESQTDSPPVLPLTGNPHYYSIGDNAVSITYLDANSHSYRLSPDGTRYVFASMDGLFTCDADFQNSKLLLARVNGSDPNGMDTEAPGSPQWIDDSRIAYSWFGYEWLIGAGIIQSDGSGDTRPTLLENRSVQVTENENLLLVYEMMNSSVFVGVYNIQDNRMTDFSEQFDLTNVENVVLSDDGRTLFIQGIGSNGEFPASILSVLSEDYAEIIEMQAINGAFNFAQNGYASAFCPDHSRLMLEGPYAEEEYQLYVAETANLFE